MKQLTKKITIAVSVLLMLGLAGASQYAFGTKVLPNDIDIGEQLFNLPATTSTGFWDTDANAAFDGNDVLYLHMAITPGFVQANDIRLTPYGNYLAGSKVTAFDNDIGKPLIFAPLGPQALRFRYADLYGGPGYDLQDPVYARQTFGPPAAALFTRVRDVRLTAVPAVGQSVPGLDPGTLLQNLDPDWNRLLGAVALTPNPVPNPTADGAIRYFDANGNGAYDSPDDVYLNFPAGAPFTAPGAGHVTVNNVRLSGP